MIWPITPIAPSSIRSDLVEFPSNQLLLAPVSWQIIHQLRAKEHLEAFSAEINVIPS
jgi:hypothetical protein